MSFFLIAICISAAKYKRSLLALASGMLYNYTVSLFCFNRFFPHSLLKNVFFLHSKTNALIINTLT